MQIYRTTLRLPAGPPRSYRITIREGLLEEAPERIARAARGGAVFLLTDTTVGRLYGRRLHRECLRHVRSCTLLDVPPGEHSKRLGVYGALSERLLGLGARRDSLIVALGGGVVGDLAGFVAATLLRGVGYVQIPTTLLAQLDSSVGGKVGIDHGGGKNMLGAFHQPLAVLIDPAALGTLPVREFRNGLAELVKIALALDAGLFRRIERAAPDLSRHQARLLSGLIAPAVSLKAGVVMKDEMESGLRKTLNLGHTVGHALEAASGYRLRHGEAVAMGIAAESRIAARMGLLDRRSLDRVLALLASLGLPRSVPRALDRRRFMRALALDKKFTGSGTAFVLPTGIGHSAIGVPVPPAVLAEVVGR